jgi:glycosyltransferase involved in cell wall biosynthesis
LRGAYVSDEQAVHSVKELFQDWEVIVVNDESQDKTGEIIDSLQENVDRSLLFPAEELSVG